MAGFERHVERVSNNKFCIFTKPPGAKVRTHIHTISCLPEPLYGTRPGPAAAVASILSTAVPLRSRHCAAAPGRCSSSQRLCLASAADRGRWTPFRCRRCRLARLWRSFACAWSTCFRSVSPHDAWPCNWASAQLRSAAIGHAYVATCVGRPREHHCPTFATYALLSAPRQSVTARTSIPRAVESATFASSASLRAVHPALYVACEYVDSSAHIINLRTSPSTRRCRRFGPSASHAETLPALSKF
jgi:hypothetical protein